MSGLRTRLVVNDNFTSPPGEEWYQSSANATPIKTGTLPGGYKTKHVVVRDDPHPGWRKRIAEGEVLIGSLRVDEVSTEAGGGSFSYSGPNGARDWSMGGSVTLLYLKYSTPNYPPSIRSLKDSSSLIEATKLAAVRNIDKTPYSMAEDVLTMRQNLEMLHSPLKGLDDVLKRYIKRRVKGTTLLSPLYNTYLAWRFGATPFVRSLSDVLESIAAPPRPVRKLIKRAGSVQDDTEVIAQTITSNRPGNTYMFTKYVNRTCKVGVFYHMPEDLGLRWTYGLRGKDLPQGLWNAVPYSFMVDRVLDVSSYCQAVMNLTDPKVTILNGYVTIVESDDETISVLTPPTWSGWTPTVNGDAVKTSLRSIERVAWFPTLPDLTIPVDFGGLYSDASKVGDLASLVLQKLRA